MSDNAASAPPLQTFVECGLCNGNVNIFWFCKNCPSSLCDTCASAHKTIQQYKYHSVVPRTYTVLRLYGPAKIAEQCKFHPEKEISSYCNECNVPCCISCLVKDHQCHRISTIEDMYLDTERRLNTYAMKLDTDIKPQLERMEEQARDYVRPDSIYVKKIIGDINKFREDFVYNFHRACDNLIEHVNCLSYGRNEALREIESSKKKVESLEKEIQGKIHRGDLDLMQYHPPKLESLIPKEVVPVFEPAMNALEVVNESIGFIRFREIDDAENENSSRGRPVHVQKINSFKSRIEVSSISKAGKGMACLTFWRSSVMYFYDERGYVVRFVSVDGSTGINDMVFGRSGEMIVTCVDRKVRCVKEHGKVSVLVETMPFACKGVCLSNKGEICVCMSSKGEANHVAIFSYEGAKVRKIFGTDSLGKHHMSNPYRVIKNDQDTCIVNFGENVVCLDDVDDVKWVYDGHDTELDNTFSPCGICADRYNNLLITDYKNECVHYVDREGHLIEIILTKQQIDLSNHWGISVDENTGMVWLGNGLGEVVIASYLA